MASTYLERAKTGTDGNRQIWTISVWVKRGTLGSEQKIFSFGENITSEGNLYFDANDFLVLQNDYQNGGTNETDMKFRDVSAWYHIVWACDSTQADNANRWKVYVNGEQVTLTGSPTITQNGNGVVNAWAAHDLWIGRTARTQNTGVPDAYLDASLAHVHFIDGTQYAASDFGQTNAASGIWTPKTSPSVTYGTNGFFLKFANSGSLGTDSSGNANNFTVNGTGTQTLDTPSNVFATINPLDSRSGVVATSTGNLTGTGTTTAWRFGKCTLGITKGKWYFEAKQNGTLSGTLGRAVGWVDQNVNGDDDINSGTPPVKFYARQGATLYNNDSGDASFFSTDSDGDIIGIAFDMDNGKMWFSKNGIWQNSGGTSGDTTTYSSTTLNPSYPDVTGITLDTSAGAAGVYMPTIVCYNTGAIQNLNFGNGYFGTTAVASGNADGDGYGIFEYAPPTGYYALCTKNINTYG